MSVDFGSVSLLGADAVGQPGQRRFRLFTRSAHDSALMWMEKEQLIGLAEALDRALALITEGQVLRTEAQVGGGSSSLTGLPADFPLTPGYEVQVGFMRLNFNEGDSSFSLRVIPVDVVFERDQEPMAVMLEDEAVSFTFTQKQAQQLSASIVQLVSSGRPVCPLCHTPLDGGPHACVKQNGHREIVQIDDTEDE